MLWHEYCEFISILYGKKRVNNSSHLGMESRFKTHQTRLPGNKFTMIITHKKDEDIDSTR